ncbi:MAG: hypothetical protein IJD77_02635 [Clostridia bacterium]|nr:hypothetical protein [Clostridia bacterium]
MKKTRLSTILLLVLTLLCSIFIFASCGENDHTHNYSTEWAKDGSYHWQACSGCEETRNKAEHDWNSGVVTLQPTTTSEGARTYTCNTCGHTRVESIPVLDAHEHTFSESWSSNETHHWHTATCEHTDEKKDYDEHSWNAGEITTTPTESDEGAKTFTCTTCTKTKTETVPALGDSHVHEYSDTWSHNDTHHWYSAVCEHTTEKKNYGEHTWNNGVITTEPTTSSTGVKTFTCQSCGKTKTADVPKLEEEHSHVFNQQNTNEKYISSAATCTEKAKYFYSCSCGLKGTETFEYGEAAGHQYSSAWSYNDTHHWHAATCEHFSEKKDNGEHDWNDGVVTTEPTTTSKGVKTFTCETCNKTKTEDVPKLEDVHTHNYNVQNTNSNYKKSDATCTAKAVYYYSCSCGLQGTATFTYGDFSQHTYTTYTSNNDATCLTDGTKTAICDVCQTEEDTITDIGSATGHSYSSSWSSDGTHHWHAATCEHTSEVKDKETHHWNAGVVTKEPTEDAEGEKTYTCDVCLKTKIDTIGKLDHVHTFDSEYSYDDNYHWYAATCEHSSEVKDKAKHSWNNGVITSEATLYEEGIKLFTCQDCDHTKEEAISKLASFTIVFYDLDNKIISSKNYVLSTTLNQITMPSVQEEEGYVFDKWVDISTGKSITEINFATAQENKVYQFKANFVNVYTVVFVDYEGNPIGETLYVREGQTVNSSNLPTIPERTGYTARWDVSGIVGVDITENHIYSPIYEVISYTVTFLDKKNGNEIATRTVDYGSFALIPEYEQYCLTTKLYGFTGWKSATTDMLINNVDGNKVVDVYSNLILYPVYEETIAEPVVAVHIDGTTVTMSLCLPDGTALYSINMSMKWAPQEGICKIESANIANTTSLNSDACSDSNNQMHISKNDWLTYNNKTQTLDFVWACGSGHSFSIDNSTVTIAFGVNNGAQVTKEIFDLLEDSTIIYGKVGPNVSELEETTIKVWFY